MIRFVRCFIVLLMLFSYCEEGIAEISEVFTWEECVKEAKAHNPELVVAAEKLNQAVDDKLIAESGLLPQAGIAASGKKSKVSAQQEVNTSSYSLTGRQLLFDGFKISADSESAARLIKAARYNYDVVSSDVRLRLRNAFVELMRANALLWVTESIRARKNQNLKLVSLRYNAGREHKGSLALAVADVAQADLEVTEARRAIELSQRRLLKELGRDVFSLITADGNLESPVKDSAKPEFEAMATSTPFLNELIARKESAQFDVKAAKANYFFPKVYADGSLGVSDTKAAPYRSEWSTGLTLSYPFLEGGKKVAEIKKAKARLSESQAQERSGRDGVIYTLQETWTEWQNAMDNVRVRQNFLEAAELRARITQAQYSNGLALFDNWIIIEDGLSYDKKAYLNSMAEALIAEAYWIQAKGGTLDYDEEA